MIVKTGQNKPLRIRIQNLLILIVDYLRHQRRRENILVFEFQSFQKSKNRCFEGVDNWLHQIKVKIAICNPTVRKCFEASLHSEVGN